MPALTGDGRVEPIKKEKTIWRQFGYLMHGLIITIKM